MGAVHRCIGQRGTSRSGCGTFRYAWDSRAFCGILLIFLQPTPGPFCVFLTAGFVVEQSREFCRRFPLFVDRLFHLEVLAASKTGYPYAVFFHRSLHPYEQQPRHDRNRYCPSDIIVSPPCTLQNPIPRWRCSSLRSSKSEQPLSHRFGCISDFTIIPHPRALPA